MFSLITAVIAAAIFTAAVIAAVRYLDSEDDKGAADRIRKLADKGAADRTKK